MPARRRSDDRQECRVIISYRECNKMFQFRKSKTRVPIFRVWMSVLSFVICGVYSAVIGQSIDAHGKNNPYSPSPNPKVKQDVRPMATATPVPGEIAFITQKPQPSVARPAVAQQTSPTPKRTDPATRQPSETYKVGVGDVLFVNLKNSPAGSIYVTVRPNGTIDYPLAGETVRVADQTIDAIESMLAAGITLFPNAQVEVKVREYASHKVTVSGMVENAGEKSLQREAMPLFVIRAEAIVGARATKVLITRAPQLKPESYDLRDAKTDSVLVYPGNTIEFTSETGSHNPNAGFYFISGEIVSGGQKELTSGLTLYQAVIASGGSKGDAKKAIIRRKNDKGVFSVIEQNLRSIRDGKLADPALSPGDVIEIKN